MPHSPVEMAAPVLIMHGSADRTVDPIQSLRLAVELQKRGADCRLMIFAGDHHVLRESWVERDHQMVE